MKFHSEDNGNCRVYYKGEKRLYCWQDEGSWGRTYWRFYRCSKDGEPSHEITSPKEMPPPPGHTPTGRALRDFLLLMEKGICRP